MARHPNHSVSPRLSNKKKSLKVLSKLELGMEMFELGELYPKPRRGEPKPVKDFSKLDPQDRNTLYYAGADAICTFLLFKKLYARLTESDTLKSLSIS